MAKVTNKLQVCEGGTSLVRYEASVLHVIYTSNEAMNGHLHSNEFSEEHLLS